MLDKLLDLKNQGALTPEQVIASAYWRDTNPFLEFLVRRMQKTGGPAERKKQRRQNESRPPEPKAVPKGPIKAETARKAAAKRGALLRQIP